MEIFELKRRENFKLTGIVSTRTANRSSFGKEFEVIAEGKVEGGLGNVGGKDGLVAGADRIPLREERGEAEKMAEGEGNHQRGVMGRCGDGLETPVRFRRGEILGGG